jgi:hypothetical protein
VSSVPFASTIPFRLWFFATCYPGINDPANSFPECPPPNKPTNRGLINREIDHRCDEIGA